MKSFQLLSIWSKITPTSTVYRLFSHFLSLSSPLPDVPGYSTRASPLHPGQQLCRGARLDRHPDQSQPVQPQTLKHLPSFSLPQRPLALLQAVSRHRPGVYALHWVRNVFSTCVQHHVLVPFCRLSHSSVCICFQRSPGKHPAGRRWRQRD